MPVFKSKWWESLYSPDFLSSTTFFGENFIFLDLLIPVLEGVCLRLGTAIIIRYLHCLDKKSNFFLTEKNRLRRATRTTTRRRRDDDDGDVTRRDGTRRDVTRRDVTRRDAT